MVAQRRGTLLSGGYRFNAVHRESYLAADVVIQKGGLDECRSE